MTDGLLELPWWELFLRAVRLQRERNRPFEFCSIINAKSGICDGGCAFCAQAFPKKTGAPVYPLVSVERMVEGARKAKSDGARRYSIVTSGKAVSEAELRKILDAVGIIKERVGIEVDVSLGVVPREFLEELKGVGVKRVHHNLESSERFYPNITRRIDWREKFGFAELVKEVGLELCCGGLFGLGESPEDWKLLADALCALEPESVPLNFLIPIPGTPMEGNNFLTPTLCVKIASYMRLRLPGSEIRICGGREYHLRELQALAALVVDGFMVGGYLTRAGRDPALDRMLVEDLGFELAAL